MHHYTYRPPKLRRADYSTPVVHKRSHHFRYISIFSVLAFASFSFYFLSSNSIQSPLLSDSYFSSSRVKGTSTTTTVVNPNSELLSQVVPFLKKNPVGWKLSGTGVSPAIGGGPGLLDEATAAKASISVDYDSGKVFFSHNSSAQLPMASTTKIMTAIVALDLASINERFSVESAATQVEPTVIGVRAGELYTTHELLLGGLLTSGNDAMAVLAEGIGKKYGGDTSLFIAAMNEKAKFLGMTHTSFTNPQGYDDPKHYTTCEDLAILARYALTNYPEISSIVADRSSELPANQYHHYVALPNWNMLIGTYPGADGVKIGNTGDAAHTTVASATRNGKRVLSIVLGADGILKRDMAAAELLNVGFAQLGISPFPMSEDLLRTRIRDWY